MAARVLLLSILFTVGLLTGRSNGKRLPLNDTVSKAQHGDACNDADVVRCHTETKVQTFGTSVNKSLELGIQFGLQPQDTVVGRNKPALLQCSSTSQNVTFAWTLDHKPLLLVNDSRITMLENGSLYFKKVLHKKPGHGVSDQGVYRCIVRNSIGALVSRPAHLRLATLPHEFSENPRSVSVVVGDPARLSCHIDSMPPALISWQYNSKTLPQKNRYVTLSGVLLINSVEAEDEGNYRCLAYNSVLNKSRLGTEARLSILPREAPSALEILQPVAMVVNATAGDNVSLECAARGTPAPQVKWTKQQSDLSSSMVSSIKTGINVFTIKNISTNHAGVYTCVASHADTDKKTVSVTKVVTLHILTPPVIVQKPKSQVYPTAKTVRFECEAKGNPQPEIVWLKDGVKLHINGRIKQRPKELLLSNTVTDDSGVYQCVATNSVGSAWAAGRLFVNASDDQPTPPLHFTCITLSPTQVQLSWDQLGDSKIQAYTVHYLPTDGGEERQEVVAPANRTHIVEKLPPYTNFTFYVRSYSGRSASDQSERIVCRTGEGVPMGAPTVTVTAEGPKSLHVTWQPLPPNIALGSVSQYKVQWRRLNNPSTNVDTVPGDVIEFTITGLQPNKKYEVRVLAATQQGWPTLSDLHLPWTVVETPSVTSYVPLLPPPTIQLTVINSTTIQVRWSLESEKLPVDGYKLSYRKQNSQPVGPIHLLANVSEYLLLELEPQTWYEIQLKGLSGTKEGEMGVRSIHTLPPLGNATRALALAPPVSLEAEPTSPTSINLTWIPPPLPTNVSYFTVSYHIVPTSIPLDNSSIYFLHSTSNSVEVSGLKPYTLYELKVRTHDHSNRHSEYSQKVECRTLEDVPGVVQDIQWKPLSASSIRVAWKEPAKTNGIILQYIILFTTQTGLPYNKWQSVTAPGNKYSTEVTSLTANIRYFLTVRGETKAGVGPAAGAVLFTIPALHPTGSAVHSTPPPRPSHNKDQFLGIILGCSIGGCCIALCMATLIYRRKCSKPGPHCRAGSSNGTAGCFHPAAPCAEHHEMECLPRHLDTKGGYPNGQLNGLKLPLLSNGRIPNGHVTRERNLRITENPQFHLPLGDLSPGSCDGTRLASDEGDSLLSGHQETEADVEAEGGSLNDTQLTHVELSHNVDCCHGDKMTPHEALLDDDGFHENETQRHHSVLLGPNG